MDRMNIRILSSGHTIQKYLHEKYIRIPGYDIRAPKNVGFPRRSLE
jgi:hypothetical protein